MLIFHTQYSTKSPIYQYSKGYWYKYFNFEIKFIYFKINKETSKLTINIFHISDEFFLSVCFAIDTNISVTADSTWSQGSCSYFPSWHSPSFFSTIGNVYMQNFKKNYQYLNWVHSPVPNLTKWTFSFTVP